MKTENDDIVIVGAGPYGLSLAAYLRHFGIAHRIIGVPMENWREHMPRGMMLKSEGFASNLYDPASRGTLRDYCLSARLPYADLGEPVSLEVFCEYGMAFQRRFVPHLEVAKVLSVAAAGDRFSLALDDDRLLTARRVVLATGISNLEHVPEELAHLPGEYLSHSADHSDLSAFRDRRVVVLGGGASAIDIACILQSHGARVQMVTRGQEFALHSKMTIPRPPFERLRAPNTRIGPSWRSVFFTQYPQLFHWLPVRKRLRISQTYLGPAGGWFMAAALAGLPRLVDHHLHEAVLKDGAVNLTFESEQQGVSHLAADHVIAATGFKPDLARLRYLSKDVLAQIRKLNGTPVLSRGFESSVSGLYFVGPLAVNSFGPVMRFAAGAEFAARTVMRALLGWGSGLRTTSSRNAAAHRISYAAEKWGSLQ